MICIFLFPVSIVEGEAYNAKKLKNLSNQRELAYDELYISLNDEINEIIYNLYIKPIDYENENEQINADIQSILEIFYVESINIDNTYYQLMTECNNKFSFPFQNKKLYALNEIFPARINVIEYNYQFYDEFALMLLLEQYENIIKEIIETKTNYIMEYIDYYSYHSEIELLTITDFIGNIYYYETIAENFFDYYMNQCIIANNIIDKINISNISFFNIPVIEIDDVYYSLSAVDELINSMKIVSSYLIENTKNILIEGVNYQTEIYSRNIDDYVNWYYSAITRVDKTATQIIGFLFGSSVTDEKYYIDNFNRIMNKNADFNEIIENDMYIQTNMIINLPDYYFETLDLFMFNANQTACEKWTKDDFIGYYFDDIINYFNQVYETLNDTNNFIIQDFTVKDNKAVNDTKKVVKVMPGIGFFLGFGIDYAALKTQQLLNSSELKRRVFNSIIENQNIKIAIINDPFNYLFDRLSIGSILFVDNYIVGINAYQHYGVYIGNGKVIHFAALEGQEISFENGIIHETTLEKFLNGRALQIDKNIEKMYSDNEIIQRARSRLGEKGYNLLTNNCEHFARWCVTGEHISYQVIDSPQKLESAILSFQENWDRVSEFIELFQ